MSDFILRSEASNVAFCYLAIRCLKEAPVLSDDFFFRITCKRAERRGAADDRMVIAPEIDYDE